MTQSEIQYYVQKRREGWDNSQVRKELKNNGYSKEDIYYYVNEIDDVFIKGINDKSELTVNNISLRSVELIVGICLMIFGLILLLSVIINGPGILDLVIGASATSGGYYFTQKGSKGFKNIRKVTKDKWLIKKDDSILDN